MSVIQDHHDKLEKLHKRFPEMSIAALAEKHGLKAEYHSRIKWKKKRRRLDAAGHHRVERIEVPPAPSGISPERAMKAIWILLARASDKARAKVFDVLVDDHYERTKQ